MSRPEPSPTYVQQSDSGPVTALTFPDNSSFLFDTLITGTQDGSIQIWDKETNRVKERLKAHCGRASGVLSCRMVGKSLFSYGRDGALRRWTAAKGTWETEVLSEGNSPGFCGCDVTVSEGRLLVALPGQETSQIQLLDARCRNGGTPALVLQPSKKSEQNYGSATCLKFGNTSNVIVGYENGHVVVFDARASDVMCDVTVHQQPIMCLDYDVQSRRGVSGSPEESLILWSVQETDESRVDVSVERSVLLTNPGVATVKVRGGDGKVVVSGGWDGRIRYFSWRSGSMKPLAVLNIHRDTVSCLDFDSKGNLAAGSRDGLISLWNLYT